MRLIPGTLEAELASVLDGRKFLQHVVTKTSLVLKMVQQWNGWADFNEMGPYNQSIYTDA